VAQETEYLTGFDGERDVVNSATAVESAGKSCNFDGVHVYPVKSGNLVNSLIG
jgi:hypothetical protein